VRAAAASASQLLVASCGDFLASGAAALVILAASASLISVW